MSQPSYDTYKFLETKNQNTPIVSIYDYFIKDYLKELSMLPIEFQLKEIASYKIIILDYCGMSSKYAKLFRDLDVYLVDNPNEPVEKVCCKYDIVYIIIHELQAINTGVPAIKIICSRNKIVKTEV